MSETASARALSVEEWHALAQEGAYLPVRITVNGWSMQPLIRKGRDRVTILPIRSKPKQGDVVLFSDPIRDRCVLHRAWRVEGERILTWGDNCVSSDGWMPISRIWGVAAQVERGNRTIRLDTDDAAKKGMRLANVTHRICKARRSVSLLAARLPEPVKKRIKRLIGRK